MPSITDPLLDALGVDALVAALLCVVLTALIVMVPAATGPLVIAAAILTEYSAHLAAAVLLLVVALRLFEAAAISPLLRWGGSVAARAGRSRGHARGDGVASSCGQFAGTSPERLRPGVATRGRQRRLRRPGGAPGGAPGSDSPCCHPSAARASAALVPLLLGGPPGTSCLGPCAPRAGDAVRVVGRRGGDRPHPPSNRYVGARTAAGPRRSSSDLRGLAQRRPELPGCDLLRVLREVVGPR